MKRSWSLRRRLTFWFVGLTILVIGLIAIASTFFVLGATTREFDGIASEEVDELRAVFRDRLLTREKMEEAAKHLPRGHPGVSIAWRIWNKETGEMWGEFGSTDLLLPFGTVPNEPWIRLRQVPFEGYLSEEEFGPLWIGMLVDGRGRLFPLKRLGTIAVLILLGATAFSLFAGILFGRKTANLLERVANRIKSTEAGAEPNWAEENPPVEIELVADALSKALARAREEQARSSFLVAGIAHELRSPIQNLMGETEVALLRDRSVAEYKEVLESHSEEIQELAREIDNLVTLCANHSNQTNQILEQFDLGQELELRIPAEVARAKRRGVELEVHLQGELTLSGDREALFLVVRNLVGNAVSFSPEGTRVRLAIEQYGSELLLTVDDQGPGVELENRERIFEPFRRGKEAPGKRSGFGLGLALAKEAVQNHGGEIRVRDSELGGARFEARIPRSGVSVQAESGPL